MSTVVSLNVPSINLSCKAHGPVKKFLDVLQLTTLRGFGGGGGGGRTFFARMYPSKVARHAAKPRAKHASRQLDPLELSSICLGDAHAFSGEMKTFTRASSLHVQE